MTLEFNSHGLLDPGDYVLSLDEIRGSMLVRGSEQMMVDAWDAAWRRELVDHAEILIEQLWRVGIDEVFLNGSFVESKAHPNDIDGYFHADPRAVATGDLERRLNALDEHKVWTWSPQARRAYRGFAKRQLPMWHVYRVELYPHYPGLIGLRDGLTGQPLQFPAAFRRQRSTGRAKGIIVVKKG